MILQYHRICTSNSCLMEVAGVQYYETKTTDNWLIIQCHKEMFRFKFKKVKFAKLIWKHASSLH